MSEPLADESDVLAVGCPYCGASSGEACWSDIHARERDPHATRHVFLRSLRRSESR